MPEHAVAVVHDYLTQRGGAERVVLSMLQAFPEAPLYTSVFEPEATFPEFREHDIRSMWTNRVPLLRRDHRLGLLVYPLAFNACQIDADVTLCSSSGFAHGVRSTGRKVVYCYTPARWLYGEAESYLAGWPSSIRLTTRSVRGPLRWWDRRAMRSADSLITTSSAVRERIEETYGANAEVVPPPLHIDVEGTRRPVPGLQPGFLLSVGRLLSYKNVDVVVSAMRSLGRHQLAVVGTGPEWARLQALAGPNVLLLGEVDDATLRWLYAHTAGLVSASFEDYGLTPIEAAAYGRPSAVLRFGGFLDTVRDGHTGVFFDRPSAEDVSSAVTRLLAAEWDGTEIASHARNFGEEAFISRLRSAVRSSAEPRRRNSQKPGAAEQERAS